MHGCNARNFGSLLLAQRIYLLLVLIRGQMYYEEIDRRHIKALENILAEGQCEPGRLMGEDAGPLAYIMNQMLYDKFHGHGWELDLLTGRFVRTTGE